MCRSCENRNDFHIYRGYLQSLSILRRKMGNGTQSVPYDVNKTHRQNCHLKFFENGEGVTPEWVDVCFSTFLRRKNQVWIVKGAFPPVVDRISAGMCGAAYIFGE